MKSFIGASYLVVGGLLLLAAGMSVVVLGRLPIPIFVTLPIALVASILVLWLLFFVSPTVMDWILDIHWAYPAALGPGMDDWMRQTCAFCRIREPKLGIIEEAVPTAFTYGNSQHNARVIVTRGLIDILTPDEQRAVVAHELGHIKHRDFVLMTVAETTVMVLYYAASISRSSKRGPLYAWATTIAYWLAYLGSLYLSRVREYMADQASAQITQSPNALAVALVKIAYGLAQTQTVTPYGAWHGTARSVAGGTPAPADLQVLSHLPNRMQKMGRIVLDDAAVTVGQKPISPLYGEPQHAPTAKDIARRSVSVGRLGGLGVMGAVGAQGSVSWTGANGQASVDNFLIAARWELFNPWAKLVQIFATHPLTALRIKEIQKLNRVFGQRDAYDFSRIVPGKYRGVGRDLFLLALPYLAALASIPLSMLLWSGIVAQQRQAFSLMVGLGMYALFYGLTYLLRYPRTYRPAQVLDLLGDLEANPIRGIPVVIEGTFTSRLDAGLPWSHRFVLQDATGFMGCHFRSIFHILELMFGLFAAPNFVGRQVRVHGWYFRGMNPYIEISYFESLMGKSRTNSYFAFAMMIFHGVMGSFCFWVAFKMLQLPH